MAQPTNAAKARKNDAPANLPGLGLAREAASIWSQLFTNNLDSCNDLWSDLRQGKVTIQSLLGHYASTVQRSVEDIGEMVRAPFTDTDRPDWAIFWWDLALPSRNKVKRLSLGRRYPTTLELHPTDLQMLGRDEKIDASYYHATLEEDGRTLLVELDDVPDYAKIGDYVGLVTAPGLSTPLAVVMVTVGKKGTEQTTTAKGRQRNSAAKKAAAKGGAGKKGAAKTAAARKPAAKAKGKAARGPKRRK